MFGFSSYEKRILILVKLLLTYNKINYIPFNKTFVNQLKTFHAVCNYYISEIYWNSHSPKWKQELTTELSHNVIKMLLDAEWMCSEMTIAFVLNKWLKGRSDEAQTFVIWNLSKAPLYWKLSQCERGQCELEETKTSSPMSADLCVRSDQISH